VLRAAARYLRPDIGEVIVDNAEVYDRPAARCSTRCRAELGKLKLYRDDVPLFSRYQVESQIETAHERVMRLPSGGAMSSIRPSADSVASTRPRPPAAAASRNGVPDQPGSGR